MPIDLTKTAVTSANVKYTPRFFDKQLIGTGGSIGIINHNTNPAETYRYMSKLTEEQENDQENLFNSFITDANNQDSEMITDEAYMLDATTQIKSKLLSLLPISNMKMETNSLSNKWGKSIDTVIKLTYNDLANDKLGSWIPLGDGKLRARIVPSKLRIRQKKSALDKHWINSVTILYNVQLVQARQVDDFTKYADLDVTFDLWEGSLDQNFAFDDDQLNDLNQQLKQYPDLQWTNHLVFYNLYTIDPAMLVKSLTSKGHALEAYEKDLTDLVRDFSTYDSLCQLSESFQTNLVHFAKLSLKQAEPIRQIDLDILLENIAQMQVPLDQYQQLYKLLSKELKNEPKYLKQIIQSNLNFRFNQLLTDLDHEKKNLAVIPKHNQVDKKLSLEQQSAVKSSGPLTLVEAGAGTGKSSVLLHRISYLLDGGINPEDVLVLSFTNAAAEHIKQLYPKVKSMTINAMVNQIYQANYLNQTIVSLKTFINSLVIEYGYQPQDAYIERFMTAMKDLNTNSEQTSFNRIDRGFQTLTELIDENPQKIIQICTALGQTTFDIQIAICYCGLSQIIIPQDITAKHILVDEVQDNSTFDFMFLLKYIIFEQASFFIVGDASQTLYAFRNANPYALNILRTSNLFNIYQLTINYRSKQEILTYANVLLNEILANRFANIQLKSNILAQPDLQAFKDTVQIQHIRASRKAMKDDIIQNFSLKKYISNCLARNEKIAFLAYSHASLNAMNDAISQMFGNTKTNVFTDISSSRTNESVLFSNFWADLDKQKKAKYYKCPKTNLLQVIKNDFLHVSLSKSYMSYASILWADMENQCQTELTTTEQAYIANKISAKQCLNKLIGIMVRFEINHNFKVQQLHRQSNTPEVKKEKIKQSNFIFSTIHSAKGLEFDNVVLLIDSSTYHSTKSEADKRAMYVGLTRAENSEYILAADSSFLEDSMLMENYEFALSDLTSKVNASQQTNQTNATKPTPSATK